MSLVQWPTMQVEPIVGGWSARQGHLAAHGRTREEALQSLRELLDLVHTVGRRPGSRTKD